MTWYEIFFLLGFDALRDEDRTKKFLRSCSKKKQKRRNERRAMSDGGGDAAMSDHGSAARCAGPFGVVS
jgi:hypothetical protein